MAALTSRKISILSNKKENYSFTTRKTAAKEKHQPFSCGNGSLRRGEVCEIVGLFLLNKLANKFDKYSVGIYRNDELALFKNINGHLADKIHIELYQLFRENGLPCNLKIV